MTALSVQPSLASSLVIERPAATALDSAAHGLTVDDLRDLMESVTQTTQRLQATHVALHEQVARLQGELAEANAALRRSQSLAALGEMAAGIAHEIRNPLGSIQLYAQMLGDDLADRPLQAEICGRINRAVATLDAIVRDVLSFARETRIEPQATTTGELLETALGACAGLMQGHDVHVVLDDDPCLRVHADVHRMTQALGNVIRNAVEVMTESAACSGDRHQLRLSARKRRCRDAAGEMQSHVALCVQDSGPGIPAEVRERIFNPFFTTRNTGTGLGLAIVHRIVDAHGGHIEIENVQPHGACVELCLPAGKATDSLQ